jgi:hypothetical protein
MTSMHERHTLTSYPHYYSYPSEKMKGRYISCFWIIFNMGAVIGGLVRRTLSNYCDIREANIRARSNSP